MGKTEMCIRMLELLNTGRVYKISDLANLLETNPRNIVEYKRELEECGYCISSFPGKFGGYKLEEKNILPSLRLTDSEKKILTESYQYLLAKDVFLNKTEYEKAMAKVMSSFDNTLIDVDPTVVLDKTSYVNDLTSISFIYNQIKVAIKHQYICEIEYLNTKSKYVQKTIKPYDLYIYDENWFLIAECKETGEFSHYKISRIGKCRLLNKTFKRDIFYKKSEYIDEEGFKKHNEWYDVKFELSGYYLFKLKEKSIGKNQHIEMIDKEKAIVSVSMQYKMNIISYILSLGSFCKVIEPEWLRDQIKKVSSDIANLY